jgi:Uma2 family endonuclease
MVPQVTSLPTSKIIYPDSDGQPMSDNTKQFRWIVVVQQNLEWLFADNPQVFVAGDLLWYPVKGNPKLRQAPDVMVVFDRPKGDRGSYQQWNEDDIAPQVVFEILSPGNTLTEMNKKQVFYDRYGVEEYYLYDPERNDLSGWLRSPERLDVIDPIANWVSPRLGIRFDLSGEELELIRPDGERFATYVEIQRQLAQLQARVLEAESLLEQERLRAERLAQRLREAGIDPDAIET